jgi:MFS transporter, SP family, sugar:H+ symporter
MTDRTGEQNNLPLIMAIVGVATIGGFMFGYDSGAYNGTADGIESTFGLSKLTLGLVGSSLLPGCAVGAFSAGRLADKMGRRKVMQFAALMFIVSALITGLAGNVVIFTIARFCSGLAVGAASVLSPAYISEVTPARMRGRLSSVQQVMIIVGLAGAATSNMLIQKAAGSSLEPVMGYAAWRWMFMAQAAPAVLFLFALMFIPESPRYLVVKGRMEEAKNVLARLFGPAQADQKAAEIKATLANDHEPKLSDLNDPNTGKWRNIVWVGIGLATFQQLVGINAIFYYGIILWKAVGFTEAQAFEIQVINDTVSIAACLIAIMLIDKIGRKPLLIFGSVGMALALAVTTWCFMQGSLVDVAGQDAQKLILPDGVGTIAFYAMISYAAIFNISWGPVMWVMLGEMFPNQMRGSALAVAGFAQWTSNFLIASLFPFALERLGLVTPYAFFAMCSFISIFFVWKYVNETKGKELEEMVG